jgi:hypothetical protein
MISALEWIAGSSPAMTTVLIGSVQFYDCFDVISAGSKR